MFLNLSWGTQKQNEKARREETTHSEEGVSEKHARTDKSGIEMDMCTEAGGEAGTSQSHSRHKKGRMTNIYLMDSDKEVIVAFVKDQKEMYNKTYENFKDNARKRLRERFANSRKLFVKVCKTCFELQRTCYVKLIQSKSGQEPEEMMERRNWIQVKFHFLKLHIRCKGLNKLSGFKSQALEASASAASALNISRASTDTNSMKISRQPNTTIQPSVTSPSAVSACSSINQQVIDQFT